LALGYEDLNDHGELRHDLALQTAVDRVAPLASAPGSQWTPRWRETDSNSPSPANGSPFIA
jgi:hypothetical protein